jgi:hypothetical protein
MKLSPSNFQPGRAVRGLPSRVARQRGVALVVTLILLSVITFLTVAFLFLSQRERGSVATTVDQSVARYAAEAAVERAKAEVVSRLLATTNKYAYDLLVSTNFINQPGYISGNNTLTNVNYNYANGNFVTGGDLQQNIANLYYSPRPPVFVQTNKNFPGSNDFRFWLDLNRNGLFEPTGEQAEINQNGGYYDTNGNPIAFSFPPPATARSNYYVGDPQWIGVLDRPDRPHGPNNKFVSRYAFYVVPSGKTLDWNTIHNQAKQVNVNADGFMRNMGVGTWELNLASFLVDLNTNYWYPPASTFNYNLNPNVNSVGTAFEDALAVVRYRYDNSFNNLRSVQTLFGANGVNAFRSDRADGYSRGPLMTGRDLPNVDPDQFNNNTGLSWSGAENPTHFLSTQDLFDNGKVGNFANRLRNAGFGTSSYDRYTFYRMIAQIGTDSGPEQPTDKIHLNYNNRRYAVTNFVAWEPLDFFTNAAAKLLEVNYPDARYNARVFNVPAALSVTNIPVFVSNRFVYTPSLHRLMQVAANIADSRTNYSGVAARGNADLPSVFRPTFRKDGRGDVYIAGWREVEQVSGTADVQLSKPLDLNVPTDYAQVGTDPNENVFGVPWVIGAKKGLPNFNEFMLKSVVGVTRRLQFFKTSTTATRFQTNQMFMVGISNAFGFEAWNPYISNYNRGTEIIVQNDMQIDLRFTNDVALDARGSLRFTNLVATAVTNIFANAWRGAGRSIESPAGASFQIPLYTNFIFQSDWVYRTEPASGGPRFVQSTNVGSGLRAGYEVTGRFYVPQFNLAVSNRIRFIMIDTATRRVIDYVHLNQLDGLRDLTGELGTESVATVDGSAVDVGGSFWLTNRPGANSLFVPPQGVINQIRASIGEIATGDNEWRSYGVNQYTGDTKRKEIDGFRRFLGLAPLYYPGTPANTNLMVQAPFTPTRRTSQTLSWQANDPLVHYTATDLAFVGKGNGITPELPFGVLNSSNNLGQLNERFEPWSENLGYDFTRMNLAVKDPGVRSPNDWNFPTNAYPNVGWLGRVHRGTPWQTVYLKSPDIDPVEWTNWTGNINPLDAVLTRPVQDRLMFDVFTTSLSDTATRGQLNVNQFGLAAWSAALGGLIGLTNNADDGVLQYGTNVVDDWVLYPAGVDVDPTNSAVHRIWAGVQRTRTATNLFNGAFGRAGDVLNTPELSVESPLLNRSSEVQLERGIDDATYERIPQMLMSLVRGNEAPRFTIYAYGQSLRPAERSIVTGGPYSGLCTNYQVTAEFVTRTVMRLEWERNTATGAPSVRPVVESFNVLGPDQ